MLQLVFRHREEKRLLENRRFARTLITAFASIVVFIILLAILVKVLFPLV